MYIMRKDLNKMKREYGMKDENDRIFIEWWSRNHGLGTPEERNAEIRD